MWGCTAEWSCVHPCVGCSEFCKGSTASNNYVSYMLLYIIIASKTYLVAKAGEK